MSNIYDKLKCARFKEIVLYREFLREHPQLHTLFIEITQKCNENCLHCGSSCDYNKNKDIIESLTDEEILNCLKQLKEDLKDKKLPFITVTGGEPLLKKNLPELMRKINDMGYIWGMTTNATLMTKEKAAEFKAAGLYSVSVSLDGLEETHNWFRQTNTGYKTAIEGIKNLVEVDIANIMVTTVVHKRNLHELDQIKEIVKSLNVDIWRVINVDPIGKALTNKDILLDDKDYKYILDYIKTNSTKELPIIYSCNYFLGLEYEYEVRDWFFSCEAGIKVAAIQHNGDISACLDIERRPDLVFGNIKKDNLYDVWKNKFEIFRNPKANKSSTCKNCEFARECDGNGWHTWDFDNNEPRICMYKKIHTT